MASLVKSTSIYTVGNIIPKLVGFVLLPIYTRYLTPSDYGVVNSMEVMSGLLQVLFTLALDRGIYRLYHDYKDEGAKKTFVGTISISLFAVSSLIVVLMFIFQDYVQLIFKSIEFYPFLSITIITAYFGVFSLLPRALLQIKNMPYQYVGLSLLQLLIGSGLALWLIVVRHEGALGMLKSILYTNCIVTPVYLYILSKNLQLTFDKTILVDCLKFSLPMAPSILSAWVLNLSDRIFIERFFSTDDVGIYSLGYKIAGLVLIFVSAFQAAYTPYFYKIANDENQDYAKEKLSSCNTNYILALMVIIFLPAFFSDEIVAIIASAKYQKAASIIPLISLSYFFIGLNSLVNLQIYQLKKTKAVMLMIIASALLNIILNFILIPRLGIYGAAYSIIITQMLYFIINYLYSMKCYHIAYQWYKISVLFTVLIAVFLLISLAATGILTSCLKSVVILFAIVYGYRHFKSVKTDFKST
jgi:O-antigen/teichoic acid export membrane protein